MGDYQNLAETPGESEAAIFQRKSASKRTRLEMVRDIVYLAVAFTMLFGNPILLAEQKILVLIQGPPVTYGEIESLRLPVPAWAVQPERPPI